MSRLGDAPGKLEARGPRALTLELPSEPGNPSPGRRVKEKRTSPFSGSYQWSVLWEQLNSYIFFFFFFLE